MTQKKITPDIIERHVVLIAPEIHWNTGNIGRSCIGTGAYLHLIKPFHLLLLTLCTAILATVLAIYSRKLLRIAYSKWIQLMALLLALGIMDICVLAFFPDFSQLQLIYHTAIAISLSILSFLLTPKTTVGGRPVSIFYHIFRLKAYTQLWWLWTRYNVKARYSQTILGISWVVLVPLLTAIIMSLVFSQFWSRADIGQVPFVCFFFSGLLLWNFFQGGIDHSMKSLAGYLQILNQIYFPREVVLLVRVSEVTFDTFFAFVVILVLNGVFGIYPTIYFFFLPFLFFRRAIKK